MEENIFVFDIGTSWTKGFLLSIQGKILKKSRCITTYPDLNLGVDWLIKDMERREEKMLLVEDKDKFEKDITNFNFGASLYQKGFKAEKLMPYLTQPFTQIEIENYLGNKRIRPWKIPNNQKELEIEEAFFLNLKKPSRAETAHKVIFSGAFFTNDLSPKEELIPLNLVEAPVAQVFIDKENVFRAWEAFLGKMKEFKIGTDLPELDKLEGIENFGVVLSLNGKGIVSINFGLKENQEVEVKEDEIVIIPVKEGQKVQVEFSQGEKKIKESIVGGGRGIIIDARNKPLELSFGARTVERIKKWEAVFAESGVIN